MRAAGRSRVWLIVLAALVAVLVIGRLLAPTLIERIVESKLEEMPGGYKGTVEGVDVRMLDAEIALLGMKIEKKNGEVPVPFLVAKELVIGTVRDSWKPRSVLRVVEPVISHVDAASEAKKQTGPKFDPADLRKQLPFELMAVKIERGEYHFRNFQTKPDLDLFIQNLAFDWDEMVGCLPPGNASCRSKLHGSGDVLEDGHLELHGAFARMPEIHVDLRAVLRGVRAAQLSPVLRHYAKIDFQHGEVGLDATYKRRGDVQNALIVPHFRDLDVMGGERDGTRFGRELGVAAAAGWLERKEGQKGISLRSKPGGGFDYDLVDLKREGAKKD